MTPLILASSSPYRRQLLAQLKLPFTCISPAIDERPAEDETAAQLVDRLARAKAGKVAEQCDQGLIIASDQAAELDGEILGKPGQHDSARAQLARCSGRRVTFFTGLCLHNVISQRTHAAVEHFTVHFRQLGEDQTERYLRIETPYDCAGSFRVEGLGISLFERLEGDDPNCLVGLPLIRLVDFLAREGIAVP